MSVDLSEMISKDVLDNFAPVINTIPERIRDEENGRYCFPEQYCNSIFRMGNKFLIFNTTSYEEISFAQVIFFLNFLHLTNFSNNSSNADVPDNYLDQISKVLEGINQRIKKLEETKTENDIKFENIQTLFKNLDVNSLTDVKKEIKELIESYKNTDVNLGEEYDNLIKDLNELKEKVNNFNNNNVAVNNENLPVNQEELINQIGTEIWKRLESNNNLVSMQMFDQFKEAFENNLARIAHSIPKNLPPANLEEQVSGVLSTTFCSESVELNKLKELKDAGFSAIDICQLKHFGII